MAKVKGPILSLGARGSIAKSQVYASWRGVAYAREHAVPSNPNTTAQQSTRNVFSSLSLQWKVSPAIALAPFKSASQGKPVTDRNVFLSANIPVLRPETDMDLFVGSPGSRGGLPPTGVVVSSPGAGQIRAAVTTADAPQGWTLASCQAVCFIQRDPHVLPTDIPVAGENAVVTNPGTTNVDIMGLPAGTYVMSAWPVWSKPDGSLAYGRSMTGSVAVT